LESDWAIECAKVGAWALTNCYLLARLDPLIWPNAWIGATRKPRHSAYFFQLLDTGEIIGGAWFDVGPNDTFPFGMETFTPPLSVPW